MKITKVALEQTYHSDNFTTNVNKRLRDLISLGAEIVSVQFISGDMYYYKALIVYKIEE